MKFTTLIAAAALATVSTAAVADITTDAGELVIIEKAQGIETGTWIVIGGVLTFVAFATNGGSGS